MNRAERRRQEKLSARAGGATDSVAAKALLDQANAHHQAGRLQEAEGAYRLLLGMTPDHPEAIHGLGLLAYRSGRFDQALDLLAQARRLNQSNPLYCFNHGVVLQRAGRSDHATDAYQCAIALNPRYGDAWSNLGNVYTDKGQYPEAVDAYREALRINPSSAEAQNNLGVALKEQGHVDEAVASYRQTLAIRPGHVEAHNNLGLALMEQGRLDEAIASFERALAGMPAYVKATYNLGIAWMWKGEFDRAVACLRQAAAVKQNHGKPMTDITVYRSRVKHDLEQMQYLFERGLLAQEWLSYLNALTRLREQVERSAPTGNRVALLPGELDAIAPSFNRLLRLAPCERLPEGALNPALDVAAIEARYHASRPEVMFIDNLLSSEALERLRCFCRESTIWKKDYENGYIGAFLGDGFASPLLLQLAEDLRLKFPRIFKDHRLTQAWAFKYDSARRGLNIHADAAAVNVNFWITPDDANLDVESGGLLVWDKEAPNEWDFRTYNNDKNRQKIYDWLKETGAKMIRIPYRANRAVVFNSDLFHETDDCSFKDEYTCRRINITLLYGYRLKA